MRDVKDKFWDLLTNCLINQNPPDCKFSLINWFFFKFTFLTGTSLIIVASILGHPGTGGHALWHTNVMSHRLDWGGCDDIILALIVYEEPGWPPLQLAWNAEEEVHSKQKRSTVEDITGGWRTQWRKQRCNKWRSPTSRDKYIFLY